MCEFSFISGFSQEPLEVDPSGSIVLRAYKQNPAHATAKIQRQQAHRTPPLAHLPPAGTQSDSGPASDASAPGLEGAALAGEELADGRIAVDAGQWAALVAQRAARNKRRKRARQKKAQKKARAAQEGDVGAQDDEEEE